MTSVHRTRAQVFARSLMMIVSAAALSASAGARVTGDPVAVNGGQIEGLWARNAEVKAYLGVPFAAPPVGDLRWRAPQPVLPWQGVRKATQLPPACMQGSRAQGSISLEAYGYKDMPVSEDCLYLNLWAPTEVQAGEKLPVLVWFHGGAFTSGGASKVEFNGEQLASKGIIVIAVNYRLNIFGWFVHPDLSAEAESKTSGNYGLLDQVAALKWVQQNIGKFGGDPQKVMIMGQSAGSLAVNQHMVSPLSRGLFQRAVAMSGPVSPDPGRTLAQGEADGRKFSKMIGASLADLRALPADVLFSLYGDMKVNFSPIVDGYFMPKPAWQLWSEGAAAKIPYMTGWTSHEFFEGVYDRSLEEYRKLAEERVGKKNVGKLLKLYGVTDDATALEARVGLFRDSSFGLNTWRLAQMSAGSGNPTYLYYWARNTPTWPGQAFAENAPASLLGAYHGSQVPYVFGSLQLLDREFQPVDRKLSAQWQSYLINFARTGDPNGGSAPVWSPYSKEGSALTMSDTTQSGPVPNRDKMEFFQSIALTSSNRPRSGFVNGR